MCARLVRVESFKGSLEPKMKEIKRFEGTGKSVWLEIGVQCTIPFLVSSYMGCWTLVGSWVGHVARDASHRGRRDWRD